MIPPTGTCLPRVLLGRRSAVHPMVGPAETPCPAETEGRAGTRATAAREARGAMAATTSPEETPGLAEPGGWAAPTPELATEPMVVTEGEAETRTMAPLRDSEATAVAEVRVVQRPGVGTRAAEEQEVPVAIAQIPSVERVAAGAKGVTLLPEVQLLAVEVVREVTVATASRSAVAEAKGARAGIQAVDKARAAAGKGATGVMGVPETCWAAREAMEGAAAHPVETVATMAPQVDPSFPVPTRTTERTAPTGQDA